MYPVPARVETSGATEIIIGKWLARRPREKVILATKVAGPSRNLSWIRGGPLALDRVNIRTAIEASLRRLRTDYIDLYQIHWPERNQPMFGAWQYRPEAERECTPIHVQLEALAELVTEGKIGQIGVSNEHPWGVTQFLQAANQLGLPKIVSTQNAYNLLNRVFEYGLHELCQRENMGLLAYSPLAFGHLTGKYLSGEDTTGRISLFPQFGQRYEKPGVRPAVEAYCALAIKYGMTPTQLALTFARTRPFVTSTIIGASTFEQLEQECTALEKALPPEAVSEIDRIHMCHGNPAP